MKTIQELLDEAKALEGDSAGERIWYEALSEEEQFLFGLLRYVKGLADEWRGAGDVIGCWCCDRWGSGNEDLDWGRCVMAQAREKEDAIRKDLKTYVWPPAQFGDLVTRRDFLCNQYASRAQERIRQMVEWWDSIGEGS
jgi:hypothetical protein